MKKCNQCGACCVVIILDWFKKELPNNEDGAFIRKYWKRISKRGAYDKLSWYVHKKLNYKVPLFKAFCSRLKGKRFYTCKWFNEVTGKCTNYAKRPNVCRNFPFYGKPKNSNVNSLLLNPICGFCTK